MPRYIDAIELKVKMRQLIKDGFTPEELLDAVNEQPDAALGDGLRCQDCIFSEEIDPGCYICHNENIMIVGGYVDPNWYCADWFGTVGKKEEKTDDKG